MNAIVSQLQRFPHCLSNRQLDILRDMDHRLDTPDRHAWWFGLGKADGVRGYRCGGPKTMTRERRLYRLGWVFGRLRVKPQSDHVRSCCASTVSHKLNRRNKTCVRCGSEVAR